VCGKSAEGFAEGAREALALALPVAVAASERAVVERPRSSAVPSVPATGIPGIWSDGWVAGCVGSWWWWPAVLSAPPCVGSIDGSTDFSVCGVSCGVGGSTVMAGCMCSSCRSGSVDAVCWVLTMSSRWCWSSGCVVCRGLCAGRGCRELRGLTPENSGSRRFLSAGAEDAEGC
jgi:hypothetical protein